MIRIDQLAHAGVNNAEPFGSGFIGKCFYDPVIDRADPPAVFIYDAEPAAPRSRIDPQCPHTDPFHLFQESFPKTDASEIGPEKFSPVYYNVVRILFTAFPENRPTFSTAPHAQLPALKFCF